MGSSTAQQVHADPWQSFNPLEADWICDECATEHQGLPAMCNACLQPRILSQDQQTQVEASQRTGELLYKGVVILAEALPGNIGDEFDSLNVYIREWNHARTQKLKVNGRTKFLLVAFPDDIDEDDQAQQAAEELLADICKIPNKVFTFDDEKCLNKITEEIINREFGAALQSKDEQR